MIELEIHDVRQIDLVEGDFVNDGFRVFYVTATNTTGEGVRLKMFTRDQTVALPNLRHVTY